MAVGTSCTGSRRERQQLMRMKINVKAKKANTTAMAVGKVSV